MLGDEDSRVIRNVRDDVEPLIIELHSKLYIIDNSAAKRKSTKLIPNFILEFQKVSIKIMENFDIPDNILAAAKVKRLNQLPDKSQILFFFSFFAQASRLVLTIFLPPGMLLPVCWSPSWICACSRRVS